MQDIRDFYVLAEYIETELGNLYFTKVKDYPTLLNHIPYLQLEKEDVITPLFSEYQDVCDFFKDKEFIFLIKTLGEESSLYQSYKSLFEFMFKEDVFDKIQSDEEFNYYRELFMKVNCISYEKKNPNPEIEYFNQLKKIYDKRNGADINFETIYTTVYGFTHQAPEEMTIYKFYALFNRQAQYFKYDTSVLFRSVSGEVDIEPWYLTIDLLKKEEKQLTNLDELKNQSF